MRNLSLDDRFIDRLKEIFELSFTGCRCSIYIFGSRSDGKNSISSDIDIAVKSGHDVSKNVLRARELCEDSLIPFPIDIVEYSKVSDIIRKTIDAEGILIWEN